MGGRKGEAEDSVPEALDPALYRDMLAMSGAWIIVVDPESRIVEVSEGLCSSLGLERAAVLGASLEAPCGSCALAAASAEILRSLRSEGKTERRLRLPGPEGRDIHLDMRAKRMPDGSFRGVFLDVTAERRSEEELRLKSVFLEAVASSSADGILVVDTRGRKILQNKRAVELWKIPPEIDEDEDGDRQVAHVMAYTRNPRLFLEEIELQKKNPMSVTDDQLELIDGTVLDRHSAPVLGPGGELYGRIYTFHDVTVFRRAEERIQGLLAEKEMLLREVHHRVKNYMGTLQSILSLRAMTLTEPSAVEALGDAQRRVQGMVMLYDKLYVQPGTGAMPVSVYMGELVDEIVANFPRTVELTLERRFDDFTLDASTMRVLGMLVNELLTNTMKYAFEGRSSGRIEVSATRRGPKVLLVLSDDGIGAADPGSRGGGMGFGLMLVGSLVKQLDGSLQVSREGGTKYEIEFEAAGPGQP